MRMRSRGIDSDVQRVRALTRVRDFLPSRTQASPAVDCDINVIVKRFGIGVGAFAPATTDPRYFGDFDLTMTLGDAMARIDDAKHRFARLPVEIRNRFDNSPAMLWQFIMDPRNADEAVEMGLLARRSSPDARSPGGAPPGSPPAPAGAGSASGA